MRSTCKKISQPQSNPKENEDYIRQILFILRLRKGTDFSDYKKPTVRRRILRHMLLNNHQTHADYIKQLVEDKAEQDRLYNDMLIQVTDFFRDSHVFETLCKEIFPAIIEQHNVDMPIRIWIALYGIIFRLLNDKELSEDVLQETFIKFLSNFDLYDRKKGRLFTWMATVSRNAAIDKIRSKAYKQLSITHSADPHLNMASSASSEALYDSIGIRKQIRGLKDNHRLIIELAYFYGYSQSEMADSLQIPVGTVKSRMRAAIQELRRLLAADIRA